MIPGKFKFFMLTYFFTYISFLFLYHFCNCVIIYSLSGTFNSTSGNEIPILQLVSEFYLFSGDKARCRFLFFIWLFFGLMLSIITPSTKSLLIPSCTLVNTEHFNFCVFFLKGSYRQKMTKNDQIWENFELFYSKP